MSENEVPENAVYFGFGEFSSLYKAVKVLAEEIKPNALRGDDQDRQALARTMIRHWRGSCELVATTLHWQGTTNSLDRHTGLSYWFTD